MLSASWVPRRVWIEIERVAGVQTVGPFVVRPATVREGIAVVESYETAEASGFSDPGASAILRVALASWLPLSLRSLLVSTSLPPDEAYTWAMRHLAVGAEDRKAYQRQEANARQRASEASWASLVAEYRAVYGASWDEVMGEPWLTFLWLLEYTDRQRARASVDALHATSATSETVRTLYDRAYPTPPKSRDELEVEQATSFAKINQMFGSNLTGN